MLSRFPPPIFLLGILSGLAFTPRLRSLLPASRWQALRWIGFLLAWSLAAIGILNIWVVYGSDLPTWLIPWHGHSPYVAADPWIAVWTGITVFALAIGLSRRKRVAWGLLLALTLLAVAYQALFGEELLTARVFAGMGLVGGLLLLAPQMDVRSDMLAVKNACFILLGALLCVFLLERLHLPGGGALFGAAWSYFLWACLRPAPVEFLPNHAQSRLAQEIVETHGCSSMAFLALYDDKLHYFSRGGSLIAYRLYNRVAVILGDPIGPPDDALAAINEFRTYCSRNDWLPAFCLTRPDYLELYQQAGFQAICLGHEAVVDLNTFSLHGRASSSYRKRYQRMLKDGYCCTVLEPPHPADFLAELRQVSDKWLAHVAGTEKRFFLGCFHEAHLAHSRIAVVYTPQGQISAFANLVPEYQLKEASIDLARFRSQAISGTMDFLFVSLFFWARDHGYDTFNLGLNALAGVGIAAGSRWIELPLHVVYKYGDRFYNFKGIYEFKRKFHPYWQPQYLVYPGLFNLPAVGLAMAGVNSGSGFLSSFVNKRRAKRRTALRRNLISNDIAN